MLRCAITDGSASGFVNAAQIDRLRNHVRRWAADGIDIIQLREKNLDAGALLALAEAALQTLREMQSPTKLLINTRADVAIAARAHGVHLTSDPNELTPQQVRELFTHAGLPAPIVSVSCHTPADIARARHNAADFILFGPVFEKRINGKLVTDGVGHRSSHARLRRRAADSPACTRWNHATKLRGLPRRRSGRHRRHSALFRLAIPC